MSGEIRFPSEIWLKIFHHVRVEDILQLSLVCHKFQGLLENRALWRHYCRREHRSVTLHQTNTFSSCRDLYRHIIRPFGWALGYKFIFPKTRKIGDVRLDDGAFVIAPNEEGNQEVFVQISIDGGKRVMERLVPGTGRMERMDKVEELTNFIQQNIVVFFFDRYIKGITVRPVPPPRETAQLTV